MAKKPKAGVEALGESHELQAKVGIRVREARARAGLSQDELAKAMGATHSLISLIETGRQNMTLQTLDRVARTLNTSIAALLPVEGSRSVSEASVVDLLNSLTDFIVTLGGRIEQDRQLMGQVERLQAALKLMSGSPRDAEGSA